MVPVGVFDGTRTDVGPVDVAPRPAQPPAAIHVSVRSMMFFVASKDRRTAWGCAGSSRRGQNRCGDFKSAPRRTWLADSHG